MKKWARKITERDIRKLEEHLIREEKSPATVEKYLRYVRAFAAFADGRSVTKELVREWKESLEEKYAPRSVNAMLSSLDSLLGFLGWQDCRVKHLKIQKEAYASWKEELTKPEYERLLKAAESRPQLKLILETIGGTGIRVSELGHFTVEAAKAGKVCIRNKGKNRTILIPHKLKMKLLDWARGNGITAGAIFCTEGGESLNRRTVWAWMKGLSRAAGVAPGKVFPHNLRRLFARIFYRRHKDIAKLADMLGHSSIDTTRLYIRTTGAEHLRALDRLGLVQ